MGCADRKREVEGLVLAGVLADEVDGHVGLAVGLVAFECVFDRLVHVVEVLVVLMVEVVRRPVTIPAEAVLLHLGRDVGVLHPVVIARLVRPQVPLTNVARFVAALGYRVAEATLVGVDAHLVDGHAGARWVLARKQRRAIGGAYRHGGDALAEVDAL